MRAHVHRLLLAATLSVAACKAQPTDPMKLAAIPHAQGVPQNTYLAENIAVEETIGREVRVRGPSGGSGWIEISDQTLHEAIEVSLKSHGLHNPSSADAAFLIRARVTGINCWTKQPSPFLPFSSLILDSSATVSAQYSVHLRDGRTFFRETVMTDHEITRCVISPSCATGAIEGAMRENIRRFLADLLAHAARTQAPPAGGT